MAEPPKLLGHRDVSTTMMLAGVRSPLDVS
jgi:hypothetical protein